MKSGKNDEAGAAAGAGRARHLPLLRTPLQALYTGFYGSDIVAARYCGFHKPASAPPGLWMHGWYPETWPLERADVLFGVTMAHLREERYWVATERQAKFLRSVGFSNSRAIGLPMVYLPEPQVEREKDTLLVMPTHSLPTSNHEWAVSDYVASISALRPAFRKIRVCVNGHDWSKGQWVHDFQDAGFEVVRGAGDNSSLERMASLFAQFEFVTTNGFGSLIAYASAFGAKVSFYGPFAEFTPDSMRNVPYYVDNPEFLASDAKCCEERYCREVFPEIFSHPADARERIEWGRTEMGWQNKVSPGELRQLFGWSTLVGRTRLRIGTSVIRARATTVTRARATTVALARAALPQPVYAALKEMRASELRIDRRERRRLESMDGQASGTTPLFGGTYEFADARAYLQAYDDSFVRQAYRFRGTSDRPFIVDGHAGIGLSVLYFKCLYPRSRILALEASPEAFEILDRNCRSYGLEEVELVQGDLWGEVVANRPAEAQSNTGRGNDEEARASSASPFRFRGGLIEKVDLLKMQVDASQPGGIPEMSGLLANVESVAVDYRSRVGEPQNLGLLFGVLEGAGFRIAVQSLYSTRVQPLIEMPAASTVDNHLRIMGFRT
jgi:hypothetical protein